MESAFERRRSGVLLHPTSLPSGDLGEDAFGFTDFLGRCGASIWQTLPLGPPQNGGSPYQCLSVHAGNPALISLERLRTAGWLEGPPQGDRQKQLVAAWKGFEQKASPEEREAFQRFVENHAYWLEDYALFVSLKREQGGKPWAQWPIPLRDRHPQALEEVRRVLAEAIHQVKLEQFVFFEQWRAVKNDANRRGILMFGDMPIFVAWDSADVWVHREYFQLDEGGYPTVVAGVPPDYFSSTGQRWGNPLYDWERMEEDGFSWWIERIKTQLELFDLIRVDHFRGFEAYWAIPASESTAVHGQWIKAPGEALFKVLLAYFGHLPLVAEDLGIITPEVEALRDRYGIPGMKVLQFAFEGGPDNPYLPHRHIAHCVVYTGTHDNDTTLGWWGGLPPEQKAYVSDYLGQPGEEMPYPLMRAALMSVAKLSILPMQDILKLGSEARMNRPSTLEGNWRWRFQWAQLTPELEAKYVHLNEIYGRSLKP